MRFDALRRIFLLPALLFLAPAASFAQSAAPPSPGQAIPGTLGVSPFSGSVPATPVPGMLPLSLQDAIDRGLKQNLGLLLSNTGIGSAHGLRLQQLSALLPNVAAAPFLDSSEINVGEVGFSGLLSALSSLPGFAGKLSPSVGPFNYLDARVSVSQSIFDWKSINAARAATQNLKSAQFSFQDAHDVVVLAVGYVYLQGIADEARIETAEAQVMSAQAVYDQASDQVTAGTSPAIDALRAKVELQTRQQQLIQARNDFAIRKLTVARVIGLAPGQDFELTDKSPYQPFEGIGLDQALQRAYASRSDYQAALSDVRAAELSRKAAAAGYLPSVAFNGDYGVAGATPSQSTQVFDVRGTLSVPIFLGGSVRGEVLQADARLEQSRERLDNLRGQIDADVRAALLNLQSSADLVNVARSNIDLAAQTLTQSRDRFSAGVTDTVEVVQSQEAVAAANEQFIASLYSFNLAKVSLARSLGAGEAGVKQYFQGK